MNAVNAQSLTLPSGTAKIGDNQYTVRTNSMPATIAALNDIPIKYVNGADRLRCATSARCATAFAVQQNIVRENG